MGEGTRTYYCLALMDDSSLQTGKIAQVVAWQLTRIVATVHANGKRKRELKRLVVRDLLECIIIISTGNTLDQQTRELATPNS